MLNVSKLLCNNEYLYTLKKQQGLDSFIQRERPIEYYYFHKKNGGTLSLMCRNCLKNRLNAEKCVTISRWHQINIPPNQNYNAVLI